MTLIQEAYLLMQNQPDENLRILIDLLHVMTPRSQAREKTEEVRAFRRTGIAKNEITLPQDFDEHFDDLNEEIAQSFYGDTL